MNCIQCGKRKAIGKDYLCFDCNKQDKKDRTKMELRMKQGHSFHCACHQVWGNGECECKKGEITNE